MTSDDILKDMYENGSDKEKLLLVELSAWITINRSTELIKQVDAKTLFKLLNNLVANHKDLTVKLLAASFLATVGQERQGVEDGSEVDIEKLVNGEENL